MKKKPVSKVTCSACWDNKFVFSNVKGKVQAGACPCFECKVCEGSRRIFEETPEGLSKIRECECSELFKRMISSTIVKSIKSLKVFNLVQNTLISFGIAKIFPLLGRYRKPSAQKLS